MLHYYDFDKTFDKSSFCAKIVPSSDSIHGTNLGKKYQDYNKENRQKQWITSKMHYTSTNKCQDYNIIPTKTMRITSKLHYNIERKTETYSKYTILYWKQKSSEVDFGSILSICESILGL